MFKTCPLYLSKVITFLCVVKIKTLSEFTNQSFSDVIDHGYRQNTPCIDQIYLCLKLVLPLLISLFKGIIIFYVCWENKNAIFVVFTNQSVQMSLSFCHPTTVHVTLFFDEFFVLFTNQLVQMSLSFCHHWSWIQTLKRPPYMIRGHVSFCQGRHPQGWWRYPAPGAHSLCCPRKTECC